MRAALLLLFAVAAYARSLSSRDEAIVSSLRGLRSMDAKQSSDSAQKQDTLILAAMLAKKAMMMKQALAQQQAQQQDSGSGGDTTADTASLPWPLALKLAGKGALGITSTASATAAAPGATAGMTVSEQEPTEVYPGPQPIGTSGGPATIIDYGNVSAGVLLPCLG